MRRDSPFAFDSRGLLRNRAARIDLKPQAPTICGLPLFCRSRSLGISPQNPPCGYLDLCTNQEQEKSLPFLRHAVPTVPNSIFFKQVPITSFVKSARFVCHFIKSVPMHCEVIADLKNGHIELDRHDAIRLSHEVQANVLHFNGNFAVADEPALWHLNKYDARTVVRKLPSGLFK